MQATTTTNHKAHLSAKMKIITCKCKHDAQDKYHGKNKRAHNPFDGKTKIGYRCTVCGDEK